MPAPVFDDDSEQTRFAALYERLRPKLRLMAIKAGLSSSDADDVVQDVFVAVLAALQRGSEAPANLPGWVYGTFAHKLADFGRSGRRHGELLPPGDPSLIDSVPARQIDPDIALSVRGALRQMPRRQRFVLVLNVRDGCTTEEIARILGRRPGTVGEILAQAKRAFRRCLGVQEMNTPKRLKE